MEFAGMMSDSVHSEENSRRAYPTYAGLLSLTQGPCFSTKYFEEIVSPAPTLDHLSLFSNDVNHKTRIWVHSSIPETLFNGSTPRLSCLELSYCNVSWKSPLLK